MLHHVHLLIFFILIVSRCTGQRYNILESKFTIKEKNTLSQKSSLIIGDVKVDNNNKDVTFLISFPKKETWIIKDSILVKSSFEGEKKTVNIGSFNNLSIFNELLSLYKNDYGLKEAGFKIKEVITDSTETVVQWAPPKNFSEFISKAFTIIESNVLTSVIFFDSNDKEISASYFSEYEMIKGLPIPSKITSRIQGINEVIFKSIKFENIHIE